LRQSKNIELDKFTLDEFNILWLFTYCIDKENITKHKVLYSEFIKATQKVFYLQKYTTESVEILKRYVTENFKNIDLEKSISFQYLILVTNLIVV
jgi:hypothetical protein